MKRRVLSTVVLAAVVASAPIHPLTAPAPVEGYAWQEMTAIGGFVLVPDSWRFRISERDGRLAYFVTKDPITAEGFDVGITINVIRALPGTLGVSPSAFARDFVMQVENAGPVEHSWREPGEMLSEFGVEWIDRDSEAWVTNHHRLLANDKTGTLYQLSFKAPSDDWEATWPLAREVLARIVLDAAV